MTLEVSVEAKAHPGFCIVAADRFEGKPFFRVTRRRIRSEGGKWRPVASTVDAPKEGGAFEEAATTWGKLVLRCFRTTEVPTPEDRIALEMKLEAVEKAVRKAAGDDTPWPS